MKVLDCGNGSYNVTITRGEVESFNTFWPCSSLPEQTITFCFDRRGNLVDILSRHPIDGPEAVALSHDAQAFGDSYLKKKES